MVEDLSQIQTPWYKTTAGEVFIVILSILLVGFLIFAGFVGYYMWQIRYGDVSEIEKRLASESFTLGPIFKTQDDESAAQDITQFIRPFNPTLGNPDAPVHIVTFVDFECPFCQSSYSTFKDIVAKYDQAVRVTFKHFPLSSIHPHAGLAGNAAACAHEQNKFWEYHDLLFEEKNLTANALEKYAEDLKLNTKEFKTCMKTERFKAQMELDLKDGVEMSVRGTPTYFVNNKKVEGTLTPEIWNTIILDQLQKSL